MTRNPVFWTLLAGLVGCAAPSVPAPTLTAVPSLSSQASLRWSPVAGAEEYRVYRSWWLLGPFLREKGVDQPFFQDSGLRSGESYRYQVSAVVGGREGPRSPEVTLRPPATYVKDLHLRLVGGRVLGEWTALEGVTRYLVRRETAGETAAPRRFEVDVSGPVGRFEDDSPPPGRKTFYFVEPTFAGLDIGGLPVQPRAIEVPGVAVAPPGPPVSEGEPFPPVLKVVPSGGGRRLTWTGAGPGVMVDLWRTEAGAPEVPLARGLVGSAWTDRRPAASEVRYRAVWYRQGRPAGSQVVSAPGGGGGTAVSVDAFLSVTVPGQPVQRARWLTPTAPGAWGGVLVLAGRSPESLPGLVPQVLDAGWAVLVLDNFNFGTAARPRFLASRDDPGHTVLQVDLRRPQLGSVFLSSALAAAADRWPEHPEITAMPLAGWGFSQAAVALSQVLARPEWHDRVAAVVQANALEPDVTMPLFALAGVPQLYLLSGQEDPFSQLPVGPGYLSEVPRKDLLQALVSLWGMPLTQYTVHGASHGGGLDNGFASAWLVSLLAQRTDGHLESWQGRVGWTAGFEVPTTSEAPWGSPRHPGVRLKVGTPAPGPSATPYWTWFPSRELSELWSAEESRLPR